MSNMVVFSYLAAVKILQSLPVTGFASMKLLLLQVVVDAIDPSVLVSQCASKTFDFGSVTEPELTSFAIPLQLQISTY